MDSSRPARSLRQTRLASTPRPSPSLASRNKVATLENEGSPAAKRRKIDIDLDVDGELPTPERSSPLPNGLGAPSAPQNQVIIQSGSLVPPTKRHPESRTSHYHLPYRGLPQEILEKIFRYALYLRDCVTIVPRFKNTHHYSLQFRARPTYLPTYHLDKTDVHGLLCLNNEQYKVVRRILCEQNVVHISEFWPRRQQRSGFVPPMRHISFLKAARREDPPSLDDDLDWETPIRLFREVIDQQLEPNSLTFNVETPLLWEKLCTVIRQTDIRFELRLEFQGRRKQEVGRDGKICWTQYPDRKAIKQHEQLSRSRYFMVYGHLVDLLPHDHQARYDRLKLDFF